MKSLKSLTRTGIAMLAMSGAFTQSGFTMQFMQNFIPQVAKDALAAITTKVTGAKPVAPAASEKLYDGFAYNADAIKVAADIGDLVKNMGAADMLKGSAAALVGEHCYTHYVTNQLDGAKAAAAAEADSKNQTANRIGPDEEKIKAFIAVANGLLPESIGDGLKISVVDKADNAVNAFGADVETGYNQVKELLLESDTYATMTPLLEKRSVVLGSITTICKTAVQGATAKTKADVVKHMQGQHNTCAAWLKRSAGVQYKAVGTALSGIGSH